MAEVFAAAAPVAAPRVAVVLRNLLLHQRLPKFLHLSSRLLQRMATAGEIVPAVVVAGSPRTLAPYHPTTRCLPAPPLNAPPGMSPVYPCQRRRRRFGVRDSGELAGEPLCAITGSPHYRRQRQGKLPGQPASRQPGGADGAPCGRNDGPRAGVHLQQRRPRCQPARHGVAWDLPAPGADSTCLGRRQHYVWHGHGLPTRATGNGARLVSPFPKCLSL